MYYFRGKASIFGSPRQSSLTNNVQKHIFQHKWQIAISCTKFEKLGFFSVDTFYAFHDRSISWFDMSIPKKVFTFQSKKYFLLDFKC